MEKKSSDDFRNNPLREHPFRLAAARQSTFPKGTAFSGGDKVSGTAQRRPLGGAVERSETEGVLPKSSDDFISAFFSEAALTADFGQNSPGFGQCA